jgi:hypothetical protein
MQECRAVAEIGIYMIKYKENSERMVRKNESKTNKFK